MKQKVLLMLSGGLDSTLALKLLQEKKFEVEAVNFKTVFCRCDRKGCTNEAKKVASGADVKLHAYNITKEFLHVLLNPKYGYGSNMNPCIDCRILMYKKAKEIMENIKADFLATGEVLGQRPMSQNINALNIIEKESSLKGKVLRPLSSIGIYGRSRKKQIELAKERGVIDYPCPAGGCLLTDPEFANRLKDLINNNGKELDLSDIMLLKIGRHFRISKNLKLVVGRDKDENIKLKNIAISKDILIEVDEYVGPVGLLRSSNEKVDEDEIKLSAKIVARYSDAPTYDNIKVNIKYSTEIPETSAIPLRDLRPSAYIAVSKVDEATLKNIRV